VGRSQLINMLVHRMPRLMTGPLAYMAHHRGVLDLPNRRLWLRQQIGELRQRNWMPRPPPTATVGYSYSGGPSAAIAYGMTSAIPYAAWGDTTRVNVVRDRPFRDAVRVLLRCPLRLLQQARACAPSTCARAHRHTDGAMGRSILAAGSVGGV
jgi:hypothetical protein